MMTPEELDKALKKHKNNPEKAVSEIAKCLGELEGLDEFLDLKEQFEMNAQDIGLSNKEIDYLSLGMSKMIISMAVWHKTKDLPEDPEGAMRELRRTMIEASVKANIEEYMNCLGTSVGMITFLEGLMKD